MSEITQRDIESLRTTLDKLDNTIAQLADKIETTYVRKDVLEPRLADIEKDVAAHQEWFTWAVRIVLAAIFLAMLGAVLAQNGGIQP